MANSIGNEHQPASRPPVLLVGSVLLLGTLLSWWGTRDYRHLFGEPPRRPFLTAAPDVVQNAQGGSAVAARGSEIAQHNCAGCHELATRSTGPSYHEIVASYRRQSDIDLVSRLAAAVAHPRPGWTNFAPGPPEPGLTPEARIALASWILDDLNQKGEANEGPGR
jgi:cytochrome c551/c552